MNLLELSDLLPKSQMINDVLNSFKESESDTLFWIALNKNKTYQQKKEIFKNGIEKVFIIRNEASFHLVSPMLCGHQVQFLSPSDFINQNNFSNLANKLNNGLLLMTNNIFAEIGAESLVKLYDLAPNTIFAVHDYDNHHWLHNSIKAALISDIYIPAHEGDYVILGRINPYLISGIPCGSHQWSLTFITSVAQQLSQISRSNLPLGKYYFYEQFSFRNKAIKSLEGFYPSITIIQNDFHKLSEEKKWQEWASHKLHWIIPVMNDLPIRFFDALITGGLPLVPRSLGPHLHSLRIPEKFYLIYDPQDILNPIPFVERSLNKFDALGSDGIKERHSYSLDRFHISPNTEKIIGEIKKIYC